MPLALINVLVSVFELFPKPPIKAVFLTLIGFMSQPPLHGAVPTTSQSQSQSQGRGVRLSGRVCAPDPAAQL